MKLTVGFDELVITTDKSKLNLELIHNFLSTAYWSKDRPKEIIDKSVERSLCSGVYYRNEQIGFARVVTDYSIFAYLADVFILEKYRGNGIGKKLIQTILNYPDIKDVKRWLLVTSDAHKFYAPLGFKNLDETEKFMEIKRSKN
jgi:N-acetylglutamate synthase-like GNAT family acetyltransferase